MTKDVRKKRNKDCVCEIKRARMNATTASWVEKSNGIVKENSFSSIKYWISGNAVSGE